MEDLVSWKVIPNLELHPEKMHRVQTIAQMTSLEFLFVSQTIATNIGEGLKLHYCYHKS